MPNLPYRPPPVPRPPRLGVPRRPGACPRPHRALGRALPRSVALLLSALIHLTVLLLVTTTARPARPATAFHPMEVRFYAERPAPPPPTPEIEPTPVAPAPQHTPEAPEPPVRPPLVPEPLTQTPTEDLPPAPHPTEQAAPVLAAPAGPRAARDLYAARTPAGRTRALQRWGGTPASEQAVDRGLLWLHRHQDAATGRWSDGEPALRLSPSLTGLALLAFLGKGHIHTRDGPYRTALARGIQHLLGIQSPDGRFGPPYHATDNRYLMYHQAIAALALAEAYALTQDGRLATPVRRAVDFIARAQQSGGGWDYGDRPTGRSDTSVTGWQLMALKSAHAAGIPVPWQTLYGALRHLSAMTRGGGVGYGDRGTYAGRRGPGMSAVGLLSYQLLGWPRQSAVTTQLVQALQRELPHWDTMQSREPPRHLHTLYYWYYGTLAMFQTGGQAWSAWNDRVRAVLVSHQQGSGAEAGSWDAPAGGFDSVGGRVYATAINVMTLEVYYRYLPFHTTPGFEAFDILARAAKVRGTRMRRDALRLLGRLRGRRAKALLVEALADADAASRAVAREALVAAGSEKVVPTLAADLAAGDAATRVRALGQLDRLHLPRLAPNFIGALRDGERVVRQRAAIALRRLAGRDHGFRADAPAVTRELAIERWEQWWNREGPVPPPGAIKGAVLVLDAQMPDAVVLDVGRQHAVRPGLRFQVVREGRAIALVEAQWVKRTLTIARIVEGGGEALRAGDEVHSLGVEEERPKARNPAPQP